MSHSIPDDDPGRRLTIADPQAADARCIALAGDTYTILIAGAETAGRYCLIDMHVPPGGGPPSHRHDFEEMFTLLEGEVEFTFRGETTTVRAGSTINIPANAPHNFQNTSGGAARMLCMCTPAGQDEFFSRVGDPVGTRTAPPPHLSEDERTERQQRAAALAPRYRTEMLVP